MKASFLISVLAGLLVAGCGKNNSSPNSQGTNTTGTTNIAAPSGGYLHSLVQADKYAVKTIDVSYLNQAVQLFNTQEGRLPKDLNELVPNYVAKIPDAPIGSKIVYDASSGQVTVVQQ